MEEGAVMKLNKKEVGTRIHELRSAKNISMERLAKAIGAGGKSTINTWEKGVTLPRRDYLESLAKYFEVSVNYLKYGSIKNYLTNLVISDWDSEDPILANQLEAYLKVATNYASFKNGVPFDVPESKIGDFYHEAEINTISNVINDNYSEISSFLGSELKYDNDIKILGRLKELFHNATDRISSSFIGLSRLIRDGIEKWMPSSFGYENETVEDVKKDKKDIMSNWPDEKILDRIYQSKLANWQLDALNKLTELTESYSEELEKIKDKNKTN